MAGAAVVGSNVEIACKYGDPAAIARDVRGCSRRWASPASPGDSSGCTTYPRGRRQRPSHSERRGRTSGAFDSAVDATGASTDSTNPWLVVVIVCDVVHGRRTREHDARTMS